MSNQPQTIDIDDLDSVVAYVQSVLDEHGVVEAHDACLDYIEYSRLTRERHYKAMLNDLSNLGDFIRPDSNHPQIDAAHILFVEIQQELDEIEGVTGDQVNP